MKFSKLTTLLFGATIVYNTAIADVNFTIVNKVTKYEDLTRHVLFISSNNKQCFDIFKDSTSDYELPSSSSLNIKFYNDREDCNINKNIQLFIGGERPQYATMTKTADSFNIGIISQLVNINKDTDSQGHETYTISDK